MYQLDYQLSTINYRHKFEQDITEYGIRNTEYGIRNTEYGFLQARSTDLKSVP